MSVVMLMHWPEITKELYDRALKGVRWEQEIPNGALFHVAWFDADGFHVADVWRSAEAFQRFSEQRLMPVLGTMNLATQPNVKIGPVHRTFNPGVPMKTAKPAKAPSRAGKKAKRPASKSKRRKARR